MFERLTRWRRIRKYDREHPEQQRPVDHYHPEVETVDAWAIGATGGGAPPGAEMPPNYVHAYDEGRAKK